MPRAQRMSVHGNRLAVLMSAAALVIAVAATGGPVVAAAFDAHNADKVDGRHAVGFGAPLAKRKGKLVATSPQTGKLPNTIIAKAPNADRLDGKDSSVYLDRYTKQQIDKMPFRRLLGFGTVGSDGTLSGSGYFPGGTTAKLGGTGAYAVRLPGYSPGCKRAFPIVYVTPQFGTGQGSAGFGVMQCTSGDVSIQVDMADSAGNSADRTFAFMIFSGTSPASAARSVPGGNPQVCQLRENGVNCR